MNAHSAAFSAGKRKAKNLSPLFSIVTFSLREGELATPSKQRTSYNLERRLQVERVRKRGLV